MSNQKRMIDAVVALAAIVLFLCTLPAMASIGKQKEIAFIDFAVKDSQILVDAVRAGVAVVMLNPQGDELAQIAKELRGRNSLDAVHIISHGSAGALQLGALTLTAQNLDGRADDFTTIGHALKKGGDILLYGCNVATGSKGTAFVSALARATQANIAASIDLTGAAKLGGNWKLEATTGKIDNNVSIFDRSVDQYNYVLASIGSQITVDFNTAGAGWDTSTGTNLGSNSYTNNNFTFTYVDGYNTDIWGDGNSAGTGSTPAIILSGGSSQVETLTITNSSGYTFKFSNFWVSSADWNTPTTFYDLGTWTITGKLGGNVVGSQTVTVYTTGSVMTMAANTNGTTLENVDTIIISSANNGFNGAYLDSFVFDPAITPAPTVTTNAATSITATGATLNGTVNANNNSTTVTFDYGTDTSYGTNVAATPSPVTGSANTSVSASIAGLTCNTLYHFRVKGVYSGGTINGNDATFTTGVCNSAPTDIALSASSIDENVAVNSTVGTLSSTDPDVGNTFTYTLVTGTGDTDNASFNISGSSLRITSSPDFETKSSYSVRVRTTDQGSLTYEKAFTVTINNLNDAPTDIALSASAINENVVANSTVGTLSSTDQDAGNTFTYTMVTGTGDTDNASFNISGSSLRITNSPDFETKSSYTVRVRTTDQGSLTYEKAFTVTINDVNEAPTDLALSASAINENVAANSTVGTLSSTDPDVGNTFTYSLVIGVGDTDNASFNISGSSLRITNSPDFETKSSYTVRVRTTDQGSLFFEKPFTVTINDVNESPNLTINDVSQSEGNAGTTTFAFTVSLSAPAGAGGVTFDIATADNTATQPSDYTAQSLTGQTIPAGSSTYSFSVLVNGDTTFEANETFFVNITNVTGAIVVDGQGQGTIVNDDPQADLAITKTDGVTTATPGGSVTYTITSSNAGPDNASGSTVSDTFPASLTCTWTCVGAGGGTCTAAGSGNINDSANLPSGGSVTYTASCAISAAATGTIANTATVAAAGGVTDPAPGNNSATDTDTLTAQADLAITKTDGVTTATPGGSATYTITASNAGPSNASGSTVSDTFPASLTCTWTCVGAGGGTCTASGAGNINDSANLPSGGSVTYTASCAISAAATGTIANTATVAAPGGVTDPAPANNSATDTDTLTPQADLTITKTDGVTTATPGGSVTYTITASNAGPSNASGATVSDTFPASLTCTWTCVGAGGGTCTAAGAGNINDTVNLPSGGSVTYTASCAISAAATGTLANTATVAAPGGVTDPTPGNNAATDTDTLAAPEINVKGNANTIADGDATPSLTDHTDFGSVAAASGEIVRTFTIENLGNASLTLSGTPTVAVSGTHAADFTVSAQPTSPVAALGTTTFQVTFDPSAVGTRSATLSINNDDSDETPYDFAIQGTGLNSAPTDITLSASAIDENVGANSTVGTLSSTDADAGNTFTYSLVTGTGDTDNASFNINGSSLRITSSPNYEAKNSYSVRVRSSDQGSLTFEKAFTITINNVNEVPVNTVLPVISGTNKVGGTLSVTTGTWTDADGDTPTFTYQWKADGSVIVGQTSSTCVLATAQSKKTITCTITADDGNGGTPIITTDGVLVANSAPVFTGTPAITGRAKIKQTLSLADTGTSDADGDTVTLSYQWAAGGVDIPGATSETYLLTVNEDKKSITCTLTADDGNSGVTHYTTLGVNVKSGFPWWSLVPGLIAPKETPWILY